MRRNAVSLEYSENVETSVESSIATPMPTDSSIPEPLKVRIRLMTSATERMRIIGSAKFDARADRKPCVFCCVMTFSPYVSRDF